MNNNMRCDFFKRDMIAFKQTKTYGICVFKPKSEEKIILLLFSKTRAKFPQIKRKD